MPTTISGINKTFGCGQHARETALLSPWGEFFPIPIFHQFYAKSPTVLTPGTMTSMPLVLFRYYASSLIAPKCPQKANCVSNLNVIPGKLARSRFGAQASKIDANRIDPSA
jgi:hypothetical protein